MNTIHPTLPNPGKVISHRRLVQRLGACLAGMAVVAIIGVAAPHNAWADTITVFNVTASPGPGGIFYGNGYSFGAGSEITIDTTTGMVSSADITVDNSHGTAVATFSGTPNLLDNPLAFAWTSGSSQFGISALPNIFVGFTGCSNCLGVYLNGPIDFSGSVTLTDPPPSVPEPATILLLGFGLLGLLALGFRREQWAYFHSDAPVQP